VTALTVGYRDLKLDDLTVEAQEVVPIEPSSIAFIDIDPPELRSVASFREDVDYKSGPSGQFK
jgi:hypothetical protein